MIRIVRIYGQITLLVFLAMIVSLAIITAHAQQTVSGASLSGTILDQNNLALSGASISATNLETNQTKATTSDAEGHFRFAYLPVGNYEIKADASGFTPGIYLLFGAVSFSNMAFAFAISCFCFLLIAGYFECSDLSFARIIEAMVARANQR